MRRAIFSAALILITYFSFAITAFSAAPEVRPSADIRNSGEIIGDVNFCGPQGTNGSVVDLVGESFSAVLGASGIFKLRYVPEGAYTLRISIPDQPEDTQPVTVIKGQVTDVGTVSRCPDNDNDTYTLDVDCNDNNASINPGATEVCDGVDNDCDGVVDGAGCDCTDADNDGFFAQDGCGTAVDCDDNNNTINATATEICDGVDNNCDSVTDEGFNLNTDPDNCGACSNVCSSNVCEAGACVSICGNGILELGEQCDDGNNVDGDGCQADCTVPLTCSDGTPNGESVICGSNVGACQQGVRTCNNGVFGACIGEVGPSPETCNGIDDNCDGTTDENACSGTGIYTIQPAATYSCASGLFNLNVQTFTFQDLGASSIQVVGAPSGPTMTGTIDPSGAFQVTATVFGEATESYVLFGQFSDTDNWTGNFSVNFTGSTFDCLGQGWQITGIR